MENSVNTSGLDKLGIVCSGACALHCVLGPIIALASPTIASFFENEWIHIGLLLLVIPVAGIALYRGFKKHQRIRSLVLGGSGMLFLILTIVFEVVFHLHIEALEIILTAIGSVFLISAHIMNIRDLGQS